jgi:putative OPT family oligopeptide transporter
MAKTGIPKNAYTVLKQGETYVPYVPSEKQIPEVTARSVWIGVAMAVLFSFSACYLGLVAGQVFEAAIPIAILAVGLANAFRRKSTILENVIIQSIGAASGVVVAGAIFTLPALYILGLKVNLLHTIVACTLGGFLGILFLIPLRKYFCAEEHGKLPFPEATATTEILATGEKGGKSAKVLVLSMLVGGIYDFLVEAVNAWPKQLRTDVLFGKVGAALGEKFRWVLKLDASAALFGLGYIIGLKYASIIVAGSVLSFLVFVPVVFYFGQHAPSIIPPAALPIAQMTELQIFSQYVQKLGIGAIAMAGIIGVIKMGKIIVSSFSVGVREISRGTKVHQGKIARTNQDMSMRNVLLLLLGTLVLVFAAFWGFAGSGGSAPGFALKVAGGGIIIVAVLSFLFTSVAARATAIVGVNPVSGMTLIALIVSSLVLVSVGLTGGAGMTLALVMGCVVCTSLSVSGGFITDLKIGYWLGTTPKNQEKYKFLGVVVSSISVSLALLLIHKAYGFTLNGGILSGGVPNPSIPAPQGNLMAVIIRSLMVQSQIPYILYAAGALIAVLLELIHVPPLPFALGMYLPIQINMPLFVGGLVAWSLGRTSQRKKKETGNSPRERGTLIASGFIAGGALMGVVGAVLNLNEIGKPIRFLSVGVKYVSETVAKTGQTIWNAGKTLSYFQNQAGQFISLCCFIGLCLFCYLVAVKKNE